MPTNADRFMDAFKAIEDHLRQTTGATGRVDFVSMVSEVAPDNAAVRAYQDHLVRYAWLRNAIVHHANDGRRRAIAEPRRDIVEDIEAIERAVTRPPRLVDVVGGRVTVCQPADPIASAAFLMAQGDFSQLPVYQSGKVVDLLTSEAIALWVAQRLSAGLSIHGDVPVADVITADRDRLFRVTLPRTTVVEALEMFDEAQVTEGRVLHAIVVMRSETSPTVAGIATVADVPKLLRSLRPTKSRTANAGSRARVRSG
jgi:CBS domain-containing protein